MLVRGKRLPIMEFLYYYVIVMSASQEVDKVMKLRFECFVQFFASIFLPIEHINSSLLLSTPTLDHFPASGSFFHKIGFSCLITVADVPKR